MIYFILPLIGFAVGALGTLIGAGGGFILMPVLLLMYRQMSVENVTAISMIVVFFNSLSGTIAYIKMKRVDYFTGLLFASATIPGSIIGTYMTSAINRRLFNIIFGIFMLIVSVVLIVLKSEKSSEDKNINGKFNRKCEITDKKGNIFLYSYNMVVGAVISLFTGFVSPILGIGGGIIHVPAMIKILCFPAHIATATSHFTLMIMSFVSVLTHMLRGLDSFVYTYAILLSFGALFGAQLGAHLSSKTKEKYIVIILAVALAGAGLRIIFI